MPFMILATGNMCRNSIAKIVFDGYTVLHMSIYTEYKEAVSRLESTIREMDASYMDVDITSKGEFFLERSRKFYERLGNPHTGFKYVHVAGTSGKGSTSTMIYEILHAAGKSVGLYTSPFVTTSLERLQVNGELMNPQLFIDAVHEVMDVYEQEYSADDKWSPSYSEIFVGIGFVALQKAGVEWVVLETSCGGRFDMTNVISAPEVAVLTNIGIDHTSILGDTLEQIAWHKAGIIKKESAIFSGETKPNVQAVFNAEAKKYGTAVQYVQPTVEYTLHMPGHHQQWNAALAGAVGKHLGVPETAIRAGLAAARLPARVEQMQTNPRVVIDGAHSTPKIAALVNALESFRPWSKLHLIFANKEGHAADELLPPLAPLIDSAVMSSFTLPGFASEPATETAKLLQSLRHDISITVETDSTAALQQTLQYAAPDDLILITGSLYFSGELRSNWISEQEIIETCSLFPRNSTFDK